MSSMPGVSSAKSQRLQGMGRCQRSPLGRHHLPCGSAHRRYHIHWVQKSMYLPVCVYIRVETYFTDLFIYRLIYRKGKRAREREREKKERKNERKRERKKDGRERQREREREMCIYIYTYVCVYISIHT